MPAKAQKLVVTNVSTMQAKYGGAGWKRIQAALRQLIDADRRRGIGTALLALDDAAAMKRVRGKPVTRALDPRQNKAAIDAVFKALAPEYLMILGSVDVVPHQDLANPASDDGDPAAYGDLPYACERPYSQRIEDFLGATRVVGRLPDLTGAKDPAHLLGLLDVAASATTRPATDYAGYLGMSAAVWKGSTALSLEAIFGDDQGLQLVPPRGPRWEPERLRSRAHFINCHGVAADWQYYGQSGSEYPVAHDAKLLPGGLAEGTVVSAECCYGAELYDPALARGQPGMVDTYLANRAYGFFGSSTIAYGPAETNGAADLICQDFLRNVLRGASLGRAALQARQEFVARVGVLDPIDLKTLAQFSLMGDPSIQPVAPPPHGYTVLVKGRRAAVIDADVIRRRTRRGRLANVGTALGGSAGTVDPESRRRTPAAVRSVLLGELERAIESLRRPAGLAGEARFSTFGLNLPRPVRGAPAYPGPVPTAVHLALADVTPPRAEGEAGPRGRQLVAVVALEQGGALMARRLFSR